MKRIRLFFSNRWPRDEVARVVSDRIHDVRFPRIHTLAYIILSLFILQGLTGILLMMHYKPAAALAYDSVSGIVNELGTGWLLRQFHVYNSQTLITLMSVFVTYLFFQGTFRGNRDLLWYISFTVLILFLTSGFTGYLLPWNERAFWATVIVTDVPKNIPLLGPLLVNLVRGGPSVGEATLGRFFAVHVSILPLLTGVFVVLLIGFVRKIELEATAEKKGPGISPKRILFTGSIAFYAIVGAVVTAGVLFPDGLGKPADPFVTPDTIKPEWYFLPAYEVVKHFPKAVGELLILFVAAALFFLPALSRRRPFSLIGDTARRILGAGFILGLIALGIIGYLS